MSLASASTLNLPTGLATDGTRLVVADTGNHRILIWSTLPIASGSPTDIVLGQANPTDSLPNTGRIVTANTLNSPEGIFIDLSGQLVIADRDNNRALIFNDISILVGF